MELFDRYGRKHDYLRIAVTDACNLRCSYCMPSQVLKCSPKGNLMTAEEILQLAGEFVELGVRKIRLTGGEPLLRPDIETIIRYLSRLPVELAITTNGTLIDKYLNTFTNYDVKSINVSLDTLDRLKFIRITRKNHFEKVFNNIQLLLKKGFNLKINLVVLKDINEDELLDFVALTENFPYHIRFIEFMPFSGNEWESSKVFSYEDMLEKISMYYPVIKLFDQKNDTAKKYQVKGFKGTFSVISPVTDPFCNTCNRLRLTADGKMKNCLFSEEESDLLSHLRQGKDVRRLIRKCVERKKEYGQPQVAIARPMVRIGG